MKPRLWRPFRPVDATPRELGVRSEKLAARQLRREGYRLLARNHATSVGEIDLVCLAPDRRTIVVVEVKSRRVRAGHGAGRGAAPRPEDNITARKRAKLVALTRSLVRQKRWEERPVRIDVVAVDWPARGAPVLRRHENAVTQSC